MLCCCNVNDDANDLSEDVIDSIDKDGFALAFKSMWSILFILILVSLPLMLQNYVIRKDNQASFVHYNPCSNETKIIQAITIKPFSNNIEGYLVPYVNTMSKAGGGDHSLNKMANATNQKENSFPEKMTKPALYFPTGNDVVAITRTHWTERKNEILQGKPLAILIIDDQKYKPSAPLPSFDDIKDIPTLLIRQENGDSFFENEKRYNMEISISSRLDYVQEPNWSCDHVGCLLPDFNAGYISGKNTLFTKNCTCKQISLLEYISNVKSKIVLKIVI